jgi:hypothetical protein
MIRWSRKSNESVDLPKAFVKVPALCTHLVVVQRQFLSAIRNFINRFWDSLFVDRRAIRKRRHGKTRAVIHRF